MLCCRPRTRVRLRRPECRLQTGTASRLMLRSVAERGRHNHSSLSWCRACPGHLAIEGSALPKRDHRDKPGDDARLLTLILH